MSFCTVGSCTNASDCPAQSHFPFYIRGPAEAQQRAIRSSSPGRALPHRSEAIPGDGRRLPWRSKSNGATLLILRGLVHRSVNGESRSWPIFWEQTVLDFLFLDFGFLFVFFMQGFIFTRWFHWSNPRLRRIFLLVRLRNSNILELLVCQVTGVSRRCATSDWWEDEDSNLAFRTWSNG
jgi:hypothetical protein